MDATKIKAIFIAGITIVFAVYLGIAAATAQTEAIAWVAGSIFLALCLLLGKHVWVLIPASMGMQGGINMLPGALPPWFFMTMAVGTFFAMRVALRKQSLTLRWTMMETAVFLVALSILQAMMRNPIGLSVLGSDTAGSKPYFIYGMAFIAYGLIVLANPDLKTWRWAIIAYISLGIIDGIIQASAALSSAFAYATIPIYSHSDVRILEASGGTQDLLDTRLKFLANAGSLLGLVACSFWRPASFINPFKPWRALTFISASVMTLLSGFRGLCALLFVQFCLGSIIRRKFIDVAIIGFLGFLTMAFITVSGITRDLPYGIQRVLTVIPIDMDLDPMAEREAKDSSERRFEIWETVLKSERYIENKWIGDGFQFSALEINAMLESHMPDSRINNISFVERCLETGDYHGFHVETIRITGALGLMAATFALIVFAIYAGRTIRKHIHNKQYLGSVIFMCIPFLIHPFWYWLIFASYKEGFPEVIIMAAMVHIAYCAKSTGDQTAGDHAMANGTENHQQRA